MKRIVFILGMLVSLVSYSQTRLTLEECLQKAREHNHALQKAALDIQAAGEQKKEAFSNYLPSISANVLAFHAFDKIIKGDGIIPQEIGMLGEQFYPLIGSPFSYRELNRGYSATIAATEPIYAGGQITTGNKLAQLQKDVMILQKQLTEKDVMQRVTENYWQIATIKYNLQTINAAEKQLDAVLKQVELFVNTGVTTRNNLLKVKLHQQEVASNKLKLTNAERLLSMLLAQQIGLGNESIDIVLSENVNTLPTPTDVSTAVASRLEMQLAQKGIDAQKLQVKMEVGKNLPTFAVGLLGYHSGFGGLSENAKAYTNTSMTNGLVFGTLSVPITSWIGGSHAIKRQKIKLQQSQIDFQEAKEMLAIDIESAWINLTESYKQIEIAEASVEEAKENLRMSTDQYKVGKETLTDLLDAETLNRQALDQLAQAKANYQIRLADYKRKVNE